MWAIMGKANYSDDFKWEYCAPDFGATVTCARGFTAIGRYHTLAVCQDMAVCERGLCQKFTVWIRGAAFAGRRRVTYKPC